MSKPIIAIKLRPRQYAELANLGNRVIAAITGNGNYTTPVPTLLNLQAAVTNVSDAIAKWGSGSNRGSKQDLADLRAKAITLAQMLKALSQYVQNTAQLAAGSDYAAMTAIITTSGFNLANPRTLQGPLQMVQNLHQFVSRKLYPNQVKLKWKKPLNTSAAGNVKAYRIVRGTTNVFSAATQIATTTKTSFVDQNTTGTTQTWIYWVQAFNNNGDGVPSDAVVVSVLSI